MARSAGREAWLADVEGILLGADVGVKATQALLEQLRIRSGGVESGEALRALIRSAVRDLVADGDDAEPESTKPLVILVVGVNGVGKTTTIGKLAHRYRQQGKKVLLVAADTFRAAAIEQLALWAERVGAGPGQAPAGRRSLGGRLRRRPGGAWRAASTSSSSTPPGACTSRRT